VADLLCSCQFEFPASVWVKLWVGGAHETLNAKTIYYWLVALLTWLVDYVTAYKTYAYSSVGVDFVCLASTWIAHRKSLFIAAQAEPKDIFRFRICFIAAIDLSTVLAPAVCIV
jgi:hypothetical protein